MLMGAWPHCGARTVLGAVVRRGVACGVACAVAMVSAIAAAPFAKLRSRGGFAHAGPTPPIREPVGAGGPAGLVPAGAPQAVQASLAPAPFDVQRALPNHLPPKRLQDLPNPPKPAGPTNPPSEPATPTRSASALLPTRLTRPANRNQPPPAPSPAPQAPPPVQPFAPPPPARCNSSSMPARPCPATASAS
jgi:hypothetical protein